MLDGSRALGPADHGHSPPPLVSAALHAMAATPQAFPDTARIIAADLAPPELLLDIAEPGDEDAVMEAIRLTGIDPDSVVGNLSLVPREDRPVGQGAGWALLAFTHPARASRFTNGARGVWYAGLDAETAIAETLFHEARLLTRFGEPPQRRPKQLLHADLIGMMTDLRTLAQADPHAYQRLHKPDPAAYPFAQAYGDVRHTAGDDGVVYHSVRQVTPQQGVCVAVLRPRAIRRVTRHATLDYQWDGHIVTAGPVVPAK